MKDRVPLYPGRVKMVPVAGQENVYDMTRADQPTQQGDPLNKATLLKDATAALFGLGADSVPDDVLAYLGKYAQHWWVKRKIIYTAVNGPRLASMEFAKFYPRNMSFSIPYSSDISIDSNGVVSLKSPSELALTYSTYSQANTLKGKYFNTFSYNSDPVHSKEVYYMDVSESDVTRDSSGVYYIFGAAHLVSSKKSYSSTYELVSANSKDAYPESGEKDGYYYQYIGIPFENLPTAPKIATGSYVGTGKYGISNPNSLTFEFPPKLLFITQYNGDGNFYGANFIDGNPMDCSILTTSYTAGLGFSNVSSSDGLSGYAKKTEDGKTITWYHSRNATSQANYAQNTYYYFAIG